MEPNPLSHPLERTPASDGSQSAQSEPAAAAGDPVLVYDGVCLLCSRWVRFVLAHDRAGRFRFASMQSANGRALLRRHGLDPDDPNSLLLLERGHASTDSEAIVRVLDGLGGAWRLARVLRLVPRALRDPAYRWLARNRYRWFGRSDACWLPAPEHAARFLD
ncbi:MAG: thiol-disulfide oxidoreductase DCC family protein [Dokdonella sp.]|uniref:thiol-disulfide oxidoreductase DCC family protein n=1 Tax=Dokdonella sp. TaxID=2291710 RepID=UPI003F7DFF79